jgi:hypothetical protein
MTILPYHQCLDLRILRLLVLPKRQQYWRIPLIPLSADEFVLGTILGNICITTEPPKPPYQSNSPTVSERIPKYMPHFLTGKSYSAKLAKVYLYIPVTCVPPGLIISIAGDLLNGQKSRLKSKHIESLIFLEKEYALTLFTVIK